MPEAMTDSDRATIRALTEKYAAGMNERKQNMVKAFAADFARQADAMIVGAVLGHKVTVSLGDTEHWSGTDITAMVYAGMALALDLMVNNHLDCGKDGAA